MSTLSDIIRKIYFRGGFVICFAVISQGIVAAPVDSAGVKVYTLDEVKVTTTPYNKDIHSAVPIQTLGKEQMQRQGIVDISDALNHFSGITLRDYGGAGGIKTVSVRGLGAAHTAVSYDGVTMSDEQTGQIDMSRFSLAAISELSLVVGDNFDLLQSARGAAAAATVNVNTVENDNLFSSDFCPHYSLHLEQGSFDRYNVLLKLSQRLSRRFAFTTVGDYLYSGNNYPYTLVNGLTSMRENRTNSRMNKVHTEANASWNLGSKEFLDTKLYYYDNNHHLPGVVVYYNPYNGEKQQDKNFLGQTRWIKGFSNGWTAQCIGKFNWSESKYMDKNDIYSGGALLQNYWQREVYVSGLLSYAPMKNGGISYGADYFFNNLNSNQSSNANVSRHSRLQSLTANYNWWRMSLSGRVLASTYINHSDGVQSSKNFVRLSPSAAFSFQLLPDELLYIRVFYKDIFRVPTFTESYYYHLGSADLGPETTHQLGVGVTLQKHISSWWPEIKVTADGYLNRVRDKIVSIPITLHVWRTLNFGKVDANGLDITLMNRFSITKGHQVVLSGNYTLQSVKDKSSEGSLTYNKQLAYTPEYSGNISLAYETPWINLAFTGFGASNRYSTNEHSHGTQLKSYMEFGGSIWRNFKFVGADWELRGDLQNMFDKQYDIVSGYPMQGRSYRISLTIKL
ncbi:MAG: TonB-dependent receptor plug domain-containing protein [Bacteroidaceae bacterium]|nr:TonB-dependent receptor plug domain-containing protein [Bacteroidaceae bacterium]